MGMWGLERLAANNKVQTGPVGVRLGATPFFSPMTRRSTPMGLAQAGQGLQSNSQVVEASNYETGVLGGIASAGWSDRWESPAC